MHIYILWSFYGPSFIKIPEGFKNSCNDNDTRRTDRQSDGWKEHKNSIIILVFNCFAQNMSDVRVCSSQNVLGYKIDNLQFVC
jgi:hypothetical protein